MYRRAAGILVLVLALVAGSPAPVEALHLGGSHQAANMYHPPTGANLSVVYYVNTSNDARIADAATYATNYLNSLFLQNQTTLVAFPLGAAYNGYVRCGPGNRLGTPQPLDFVVPICLDSTLAGSQVGITAVSSYGNQITAWSAIYMNPNHGCINSTWCLRNAVLHEMLHGLLFNAPPGHSADPNSIMYATATAASYSGPLYMTGNELPSFINCYPMPVGSRPNVCQA